VFTGLVTDERTSGEHHAIAGQSGLVEPSKYARVKAFPANERAGLWHVISKYIPTTANNTGSR